MGKTEEFQQAIDARQADEAREALVSDSNELKEGGELTTTKVESKLPLIVAGVCGLAAIGAGLAIASRQKRPWYAPRRRSLLGTALRAVALRAAGMLARRVLIRVVNKTLSEALV